MLLVLSLSLQYFHYCFLFLESILFFHFLSFHSCRREKVTSVNALHFKLRFFNTHSPLWSAAPLVLLAWEDHSSHAAVNRCVHSAVGRSLVYLSPCQEALKRVFHLLCVCLWSDVQDASLHRLLSFVEQVDDKWQIWGDIFKLIFQEEGYIHNEKCLFFAFFPFPIHYGCL